MIIEDKVVNLVNKLVSYNILPEEINDEFNEILDKELHRSEIETSNMKKYEEFLCR